MSLTADTMDRSPIETITFEALERATVQQIVTTPFPHLVIPDALPSDLYHALISCRPDPFHGDATRPNTRIPIPAHLLMTLGHIPPLWAALAKALSDPKITQRVAALFADHLDPAQPLRSLVAPQAAPRTFGLVHRDCPMDVCCETPAIPLQPSAPIFTEARLEVVSPSGEIDGGSHRRAHLDSRARLFTALLYLRPDGDDSRGGGLDLFRWLCTPTPSDCDAFELDHQTVERVATLPYQGNMLVLFPQCPQALHGMAPRGPTSHQRAYMFISAQVPDPWF